MIYRTAEQCWMWPRLIEKAQTVDSDLATAFRDLLKEGAGLTVAPTMLQLGPGAMPEAEYNRVKEEKLAPKRGRVLQLLTTARESTHPWLQPVAAAYKDLAQRCQKGDAAMRDASKQGDKKRFVKLVPQVMDRHLQANLISQALYMAGYNLYAEHLSRHMGRFLGILDHAQQAGIPYDTTRKAWPVEVPDGRVWVVDYADFKPEGYAEGDLILTDAQLAQVLATIETAREQFYREVG